VPLPFSSFPAPLSFPIFLLCEKPGFFEQIAILRRACSRFLRHRQVTPARRREYLSPLPFMCVPFSQTLSLFSGLTVPPRESCFHSCGRLLLFFFLMHLRKFSFYRVGPPFHICPAGRLKARSFDEGLLPLFLSIVLHGQNQAETFRPLSPFPVLYCPTIDP